MATCFAQLFWGLLVIILDISINGFDLLMDGVGCLIVAAGCRELVAHSPRFGVARTLCFVLAAIWLLGFFTPRDLTMVVGLVALALNCLMIWHLLGGIGDVAIQRQRPDLATRADNRRLAYVIIMIGSTLLGFALRRSRDAAPLVFVLVVAMLVLLVMILHLIHRAKLELAT